MQQFTAGSFTQLMGWVPGQAESNFWKMSPDSKGETASVLFIYKNTQTLKTQRLNQHRGKCSSLQYGQKNGFSSDTSSESCFN